MISNLSVAQFIVKAIAVIISLTIHEYAHGLISSVQGDKTPKQYGRLTLNPLAHVDIAGLIALFVFRFGWAKPVPIDSRYYKNQRWGIIFTSLAGPIANIIMSFISAILIVALNPQQEIIAYFLSDLCVMNAGLAVFNMIPFPPLDGSKVFAELFGGKIAELIYSIERSGTIILFLILWIPQVSNMFSNAIFAVVNVLFTVASAIV